MRTDVAVCIFDRSGKPHTQMIEPLDRKLSAPEYQTVLAMRADSRHMVQIPGSNTSSRTTPGDHHSG
jgi:hypothetical protein